MSGLFGWLRGGSPDDKAAREEAARRRVEIEQQAQANHEAELARQAEDLRSLAGGGIPVMARQRLKEQAGDPNHLFTSDLSPTELGLLRQAGFRACGLVTGSAMYHVGQAYASDEHDCEVTVLSQAYDKAMELAVGRLEQEARLMGAHGVVGVRLELVRHEWSEKTVEVLVMGTAVTGPANSPKAPWLCDLSVEEWWALHQAGYDSLGLVWGHSAWFVLTKIADERAVISYFNQELFHWSQALSQARIRAMMGVKRRAENLHASGIAGVRLSRRLDEVHLTEGAVRSYGAEMGVYEREHHNLVVAIVGTAIQANPDRPTQYRAAQLVLSLSDGQLGPSAVGAGDLAIAD